MAGAYTSLPEAAIPVTYPPLWNPDWIFPGPLPPGFSTAYQLFASGDTSAYPGSPVNIMISLIGAGSGEPDGDVEYTATMDGSPITMCRTSGGSYLSTQSGDYTDDNSMYCNSASFYFPISSVDVGKIIAITATSTPFTSALSATHNVTVKDKQPAAILVAPTSGLETTPYGDSDTFTVKLLSRPKAPKGSGGNATVIVPLSLSSAEGTIDKSSLTFTQANYATNQTVTITGRDNGGDYGVGVKYQAITGRAKSVDDRYNGYKASNVELLNKDYPGFILSSLDIDTGGPGGTASYKVKLKTQPSSDVVLTCYGSLESECAPTITLDKHSLTFTSVNWNTNQTVTATGKNVYSEMETCDETMCGVTSIDWLDSVQHTVVTTDPDYSLETCDDVVVHNTQVLTCSAPSRLAVGHGPGTKIGEVYDGTTVLGPVNQGYLCAEIWEEFETGGPGTTQYQRAVYYHDGHYYNVYAACIRTDGKITHLSWTDAYDIYSQNSSSRYYLEFSCVGSWASCS